MLINHFGKDNAISFLRQPGVLDYLRHRVDAGVAVHRERAPEDFSEESRRAEEEKRQLTLAQSLKRLYVELASTLRIRIFRQHLGMYLGGYIAQDVFNAVFTGMWCLC